MNDLSFSNMVAIVTGASSGIGREIALALAEKGARLVLAARSVGALEELAEKVRDGGGEVLVVPTDVTLQAQVNHLVEETVRCFGRVDLLISNAGQYIRSPVSQIRLAYSSNLWR
jgi:NADP-dependent 3-hydroxy acid dehydrogenase YdfG